MSFVLTINSGDVRSEMMRFQANYSTTRSVINLFSIGEMHALIKTGIKSEVCCCTHVFIYVLVIKEMFFAFYPDSSCID